MNKVLYKMERKTRKFFTELETKKIISRYETALNFDWDYCKFPYISKMEIEKVDEIWDRAYMRENRWILADILGVGHWQYPYKWLSDEEKERVVNRMKSLRNLMAKLQLELNHYGDYIFHFSLEEEDIGDIWDSLNWEKKKEFSEIVRIKTEIEKDPEWEDIENKRDIIIALEDFKNVIFNSYRTYKYEEWYKGKLGKKGMECLEEWMIKYKEKYEIKKEALQEHKRIYESVKNRLNELHAKINTHLKRIGSNYYEDYYGIPKESVLKKVNNYFSQMEKQIKVQIRLSKIDPTYFYEFIHYLNLSIIFLQHQINEYIIYFWGSFRNFLKFDSILLYLDKLNVKEFVFTIEKNEDFFNLIVEGCESSVGYRLGYFVFIFKMRQDKQMIVWENIKKYYMFGLTPLRDLINIRYRVNSKTFKHYDISFVFNHNNLRILKKMDEQNPAFIKKIGEVNKISDDYAIITAVRDRDNIIDKHFDLICEVKEREFKELLKFSGNKINKRTLFLVEMIDDEVEFTIYDKKTAEKERYSVSYDFKEERIIKKKRFHISKKLRKIKSLKSYYHTSQMFAIKGLSKMIKKGSVIKLMIGDDSFLKIDIDIVLNNQINGRFFNIISCKKREFLEE